MNTKTSYVRIALLGVVAVAFLVAGCDLINFTEVRNPQVTEESLEAGGTGATVPFLNGLMDGFSDAVEDIAYWCDVVSDNYDNVATFISPACDFPRTIFPFDLTLDATDSYYFDVQEMRALADFVINGVIPNDPDATDADLAEAYFFRGYGLLLLGENFAGAPIAENGLPQTQAELVQLAIDDFDAAEALDDGIETRLNLLRARAYRLLGDKTNAVAMANAAIASGPADFTFWIDYDAANNENTAFNFAVSRNLNDIQPLPRLDFLDPKYTVREAPIYVAKMEEAHFILCEASLSDGAAATAAGHLAAALTLAASRPTLAWADPDPRELRPAGGTVQASAAAPAIDGLILPRGGALVNVPYVSGTSLDPATIGALTTGTDVLYNLYLARQEVFFLEGRRMADLGIALCMMNREIEMNPNISDGDLGTETVVPAWIPPQDEMDQFTTDGANTIILHDMNQVIVDNRADVCPFAMPF